MRSRLPWIALTGLSLFLPLTPAPASVERGTKHFLWKVTSPSTEAYLMGSIHLGKKEFYPLPKEIESAFDRSKYLVLEADETKLDQAKLQQMILERGLYGEGDGLSKHVPPATLKAANAMMEGFGMPAGSTERMKPWFLAITASLLAIQKLEYSPEFGIDRHFAVAAKEKGREILELESMEFQVKLLSGFADDEQVKFLDSTLEETKNAKERMDTIVSAWSKGDAAALEEELIRKPLQQHPEQAGFMAKMIDDRNVGMAKKVGGYLKTKDVYFVVVGGAHLLGEKGMLKLLEKDGFKVEQLEAP
jgi:uncharacterized protein YbaP (TraB family)